MQLTATTFNNLKLILQVHSKGVEVVVNQDDTYYLQYPQQSKNSGMIFAYVQQRRQHIVFYFQPLAINEKLFSLCSAELAAVLQSNCRFHLSLNTEPALIRELLELTNIAMSVTDRHYQPLFRTTFLN